MASKKSILDTILSGAKSEMRREARYQLRSIGRKLTKKVTGGIKDAADNAREEKEKQKLEEEIKGKKDSRDKKEKKNEKYESVTFRFDKLPTNLEELKAMDEASLDTPFKAAALSVAVMCNFENDEDATYEMLNYLKGPQPLSTYEKQWLRERLVGKIYVPFSFFEGTKPSNSYTPTQPYTITLSEDAYSHAEEKYCRLNMVSSGADNPRQIKLRTKGGQWFLWEMLFLSDIRTPTEADPWED